jgi:hypothetical protein
MAEELDLEEMRESVAEMSDEALMQQRVEQTDDFRPEAVELMDVELQKRGFTRSEIERRRAQFLAHRQGGPMVAVADFEERLFAQQAQDVLAQEDVDSVILDTGSPGPGEFPVPDVEGRHVVLVPEADAERAKLMLSVFAPAAGEDETE